MVLKIPPPPQLTGPQWQSFNRWLLELTSILANTGGIDPSQVSGLVALEAQVATNTTNIATLEAGQGGQGGAITALQLQITFINSEIATVNGQLTTLESNAVVRNGSGAPAGGLGSNGDLYLNNTGGAGTRLYGKIGGAWTVIA
jgi:hypothetical protein